MYKCLTCTKNNINKDASFYICNTCIDRQKHQEHDTVKYDDKNYYCLDGSEYSCYCTTCGIDLCEKCEINHKNEKISLDKFKSINLISLKLNPYLKILSFLNFKDAFQLFQKAN